ncbi:hypothetical protein [Paenarthrobacter nitroguajacolicus]|uniref:hypothetical protein n=1 Tax=Paenarthrobacter nitroguajacolicus TaxID=211146 RepID=UPI0040547CFB
MPLILDALLGSDEDPPVRRLIQALGGEPASAKERLVGEPAYQSRRLQFASGVEVILHDDAVVAVVLHAAPTEFAAHGSDLPAWIPGINHGATLEDLKKAIDAPRYVTSMGFTLDGAYAVPTFKDHRGWNEPGNLLSITLTVEAPGRSCRPEDDDCPVCSELLVRGEDPDAGAGKTADGAGGVDVERTIAGLSSAVSARPAQGEPALGSAGRSPTAECIRTHGKGRKPTHLHPVPEDHLPHPVPRITAHL